MAKDQKEVNKLGRNEPCSCGSGKKYKKCCIENSEAPSQEGLQKAVQEMHRKMQEQERLKELGIYVNIVPPVIFKGQKVWAFSNTLVVHRPKNETFHDFIIDLARLQLGKEWWESQGKLKNPHYIFLCFQKLYEWRKKNISETKQIKEGVWAEMPDGYTKYLLALAFDMFILKHKNFLPDEMLHRLKDRKQYQGARYEIAVASIFVRLDYSLEYLDNESAKQKHCEFLARKGKEEILVEAKSRHRQGILHEKGVKDSEKIIKGDVERLFKKAKDKTTDKAFMIFIDINSPITTGVAFEDKKWFQDIKTLISKKANISVNPATYNAIVFTNYSFHYEGGELARPSESVLVILKYTKYQFADKDKTLEDLNQAITHYGSVPNIDVDGIYF